MRRVIDPCEVGKSLAGKEKPGAMSGLIACTIQKNQENFIS